MKRYPLQPLLALRGHRTGVAQRALLERQREAGQRRDECTRIEGEIIALDFERSRQAARLLDPPPAGVGWPAALAQREAHVDWLQTQAAAARERLFQAQEVLRQAEIAVQRAREAFFKARAREEALEEQRQLWRAGQHALELRQEEAAADEQPLAIRPHVAFLHRGRA